MRKDLRKAAFSGRESLQRQAQGHGLTPAPATPLLAPPSGRRLRSPGPAPARKEVAAWA